MPFSILSIFLLDQSTQLITNFHNLVHESAKRTWNSAALSFLIHHHDRMRKPNFNCYAEQQFLRFKRLYIYSFESISPSPGLTEHAYGQSHKVRHRPTFVKIKGNNKYKTNGALYNVGICSATVQVANNLITSWRPDLYIFNNHPIFVLVLWWLNWGGRCFSHVIPTASWFMNVCDASVI